MKRFLLIFSLFVFLFAGCQKEKVPQVTLSEHEPIERASVTDYLASSDADLLAAKGAGNETIYVSGGVETVMQRQYKEPLFDFDAKVEYFLNSGSVSEIAAVFDGASRDALIANMTSALGKPIETQEESDETQFSYRWELDGVSYTLLHPQDSSPTVIIRTIQ